MMLLLVKKGTSLTPGRSGTVARAPTLMKMRSASSSRPLTAMRRAAMNFAWPCTNDTCFMPAIHFFRRSTDWRTMRSLRRFTPAMSTRTLPAEKPYSAPRRAI